ncbi:MAG: hypothetical protein FKY71_20190 [Spiribacter salinus]|uniref:Uncharacterized protein n=1 Tax=Spiribacter salinus TaxID=1335746 RepID=A0A540V432_9GAMM|nr:MAG: hypothetical protein FKY71_20190 [Spiribacter salinus]
MSKGYSGHRTFRENGVTRHEALTPEQAEALWLQAEERERHRAELMPDEQSAILMLFEAFQRLKDLGWQEAIYCPKDGTVFDAIQAGITMVADCRYVGDWPNGRWEVIADDDLWPAHPILWRPKRE